MPPLRTRADPAPTAEQPPAEGAAAEVRFLVSVFAELRGDTRERCAKDAARRPLQRRAPAPPCSAE